MLRELITKQKYIANELLMAKFSPINKFNCMTQAKILQNYLQFGLIFVFLAEVTQRISLKELKNYNFL